MSQDPKRLMIARINRALKTAPKRRTAWQTEAMETLIAAREMLANTVSTREAGIKGGNTVKERHGAEFYKNIGKKGGSATSATYGPEHYKAIGKKGGTTAQKRHGPEHYKEIGKKGGARLRELVELARKIEDGES